MKPINFVKTVLLGLSVSSAGAFAAQDPLVLVKRVTGVDEQGVERVLLEDRAGVVSRVSDLATVAGRVNPKEARAGVYRDIRIELAAGAFATDEHGLATRKAIAREDQVMHLEGTLVVKKTWVDNRGLALQPQDESLRLNRQDSAGRMS
jgi:hypothetical protein